MGPGEGSALLLEYLRSLVDTATRENPGGLDPMERAEELAGAALTGVGVPERFRRRDVRLAPRCRSGRGRTGAP